MTAVYGMEEIRRAADGLDVLPLIEEGFVAYSEGKCVVPPVGELIFEEPPGDVHIKYGYIRGDDVYVIKIASGFPDNRKHGRPSGDGLMLVFDSRTGGLISILQDRGYLTDLRTAAAGAVAACCLAPRKVRAIGVFGAGVQGRMQVEALMPVIDCREVVVWGMDDKELEAYKRDMERKGLRVRTTRAAEDIGRSCNLIVTATPSREPLLFLNQIQPGTHITAVGADTADKQELDPAIAAAADICVVDSLPQSRLRGEVYRAQQAGVLKEGRAIELGRVISDPSLRRRNDRQLTLADLTGVAVQDIQIAKAVTNALRR
ncbi:MAG: ornithine cyclodeaminase family protein [Acidobacteria bacterium]|nr:ornithine cyclodeaminase family protein [Acidobacteriota bacterium]